MGNLFKGLAVFIVVAVIINTFLETLDDIAAGEKCTAELINQGIKPEQIYTSKGTCYLRTK